jgi:Pyridoxal-dependent decarboxylase conserved domain
MHGYASPLDACVQRERHASLPVTAATMHTRCAITRQAPVTAAAAARALSPSHENNVFLRTYNFFVQFWVRSMDEYPQVTELHKRCVNMLSRLFNAPLGPEEEATGTGCIGSSEAIMLVRFRNICQFHVGS